MRVPRIQLSQRAAIAAVGILAFAWMLRDRGTAADRPDEYVKTIRPLIDKYCFSCHSAGVKKGGLDLERFTTADAARKDLKACEQVFEMLTAGEMPPAGKPQPTADERKTLIAWTRGLLDAEARARAGDPGHVPLRRLSNAEYDYTIRDLTGVDLRPAQQFPADGAGGEGFANAAEALTDISPTLFSKYFDAAKEIAGHPVLLPDGFRFSPGKTRRDWTNESVGRLRQFYTAYTADGRLPIQPYLAATVHHRTALFAGDLSIEQVAAREKLNAKYLGTLWRTLTDDAPSYPLDLIRGKWRMTSETRLPNLVAEIAAWQNLLWTTVPIGSYRYGNTVRQVAQDPSPAEIRKTFGFNVRVGDLSRVFGFEEFRCCFPRFICFPEVIPTDEAVSLKLFHREDEPLIRLFLSEAETHRIDQLWTLHRFISRQPVAENAYLPLFIGFVTQDQPKELLAYFEGQRPAFRKRADDFEKEEEAAIAKQLTELWRFAARAYRRPLSAKESADLDALYRSLRNKGLSHDEAFRGVLARILTAPAFLFRIERAPLGKTAGPIDDWELAARLSYFLWASTPDDELRSVAAAGRLHEPAMLAEQTRRMIKDPRVRGLAIEFGTQWIHVRGFDEFNEKNESLFPTITAELRKAINEESILFFQSLFQDDGTVTQILDADHTFLNETLARHYGIPGVVGPHFRRVEGVRQYGRGGILGLASMQAKQSGASRTSPVLRGNWVVETLLGEKLPRPPANVPKLPENEGGVDGLTTRQRVEKHVNDAACAVCHVRIDPYGFALERYDPIGRRRDQDLGGHPVDVRAKLKDGTEFADIDGLRHYLLTTKRYVFARLFCRKLLGYALGRSVALSDKELIDEMVAALDRKDGQLSAAVLAIVCSPQFRMVRGREYAE
jgi:hypothetical protein